MRPMITIGAVVLLHLGVIAVLVGVNGCRTTSGFEKPGDLSAYTGAPGVTAAAPAPAGLNEPAPEVPAAPAAPRASKVGHGGTYTVVRGDSLWLVARRERVSLAALAAANGIEVNAILREGQKLVIPSADTSASTGPAPTTPAPRSSLAAPEGGFGGFGTGTPAPAAPAAPAPAAPEAPAAPAPVAPAPRSPLAAPEGGFGGFGAGQR